MDFLLFAAGLAAIIKGADWLTDGAVWAARRLAVPEVIVGATLLSVATTLPELAVSVLAASTGHTGLAVGNVVGSCIANIGLILGLSVAVSGTLSSKARPFTGKILLAIVTSLLVLGLALNGQISRSDGIILLLVFGLYVLYIGKNLYSSSTGSQQQAGTINLWAVFAGVILLTVGSRITVTSGVNLARLFGIPEMVIGLSLISVGTSLPELTASLIAAMKGHFALCVGNVVGANMLNLTLVMGLASVIRPLPLDVASLTLDMPAMVYFGIVLVILTWIPSPREKWKGYSLVLSYGSYLWILMTR